MEPTAIGRKNSGFGTSPRFWRPGPGIIWFLLEQLSPRTDLPCAGDAQGGVFPGGEQGEDPANLEEGRGFGEPSGAGASRARVLEEAEGLRAGLEQAKSRGEFGAWVVRHKAADRSVSPLSAARLWEDRKSTRLNSSH